MGEAGRTSKTLKSNFRTILKVIETDLSTHVSQKISITMKIVAILMVSLTYLAIGRSDISSLKVNDKETEPDYNDNQTETLKNEEINKTCVKIDVVCMKLDVWIDENFNLRLAPNEVGLKEREVMITYFGGQNMNETDKRTLNESIFFSENGNQSEICGPTEVVKCYPDMEMVKLFLSNQKNQMAFCDVIDAVCMKLDKSIDENLASNELGIKEREKMIRFFGGPNVKETEKRTLNESIYFSENGNQSLICIIPPAEFMSECERYDYVTTPCQTMYVAFLTTFVILVMVAILICIVKRCAADLSKQPKHQVLLSGDAQKSSKRMP